jgi:hypothetical protein
VYDLSVLDPAALSRLRARLTTLVVGIFILLTTPLVGILILLVGPRLRFMLEPALLTTLLIALAVLTGLLSTLIYLVRVGVVRHSSLLSVLCQDQRLQSETVPLCSCYLLSFPEGWPVKFKGRENAPLNRSHSRSRILKSMYISKENTL